MPSAATHSGSNSSKASGEGEDDEDEEYTDEEDSSDEDEEEEEPVLKYEKIGKAVNDILQKDSASAIAVGPTYFVSTILEFHISKAYSSH